MNRDREGCCWASRIAFVSGQKGKLKVLSDLKNFQNSAARTEQRHQLNV